MHELAAFFCRYRQQTLNLAGKKYEHHIGSKKLLLPNSAARSTIDNQVFDVAAAAGVGSKKYEPCLRECVDQINADSARL